MIEKDYGRMTEEMAIQEDKRKQLKQKVPND